MGLPYSYPGARTGSSGMTATATTAARTKGDTQRRPTRGPAAGATLAEQVKVGAATETEEGKKPKGSEEKSEDAHGRHGATLGPGRGSAKTRVTSPSAGG